MTYKVTDYIIYVGVNDHDIDLFEGQYKVPYGMAYNSYIILDERIVIVDTVDRSKTDEWLENIASVLGDKLPSYLLIQHMEPDHAGSIQAFIEKYPDVTVIGNDQIFTMIDQFFPELSIRNTLKFQSGDNLRIGNHVLNFVFAPMVHWPEVMMTYESTEKVLFSADGFGRFGAQDIDIPWADEARRYFIGIVGKYGDQVQTVLDAAAGLNISIICPTHGPVLKENLGYYIGLYDAWSAYRPEEEGVCICYTSVYGHTREAAKILFNRLQELDVPQVKLFDLARCDMAEAIADAFRYDTLVLATTTYNGEIFPFMSQFIMNLTERNFQNRRIAFIENGSWAPNASNVMGQKLSPCRNLEFAKNNVTILSSLNDATCTDLENLAQELGESYSNREKLDTLDPTTLFKIGYGLYVITSNDGTKDNGMICNTVCQISVNPNRIAVNINKANYSCEIIGKTGKLNVCIINKDAEYNLFTRFGHQTGRDTDKFSGFRHVSTSPNGLKYLTKFSNSYISGTVVNMVDMGSHMMFICDISESVKLNEVESMPYSYYQEEIKPSPGKTAKGYVCNVCGYVYEGDELPADFICPLCKHGAEDFSKL